MRVQPEPDVAALAHVRARRDAIGTLGRQTVRALAHIRWANAQTMNFVNGINTSMREHDSIYYALHERSHAV